MKNMRSLFLAITALLLLQACGGGNATLSDKGEKIDFRYARNLEMEEHDGFTLAKIRNPWDTTKLLHSYILLDDGVVAPEGYPGADIINVPLKRSVVYSAVHNSLIDEFGVSDAITGICDTEYIYNDSLKRRLKSGVIADCGSSMSPNVEKILKLRPGAVLLSPFEGSGGYGKLGHAGITIVECADYMEISPLARAEWMRFYGRLYGCGEKSDSMFIETERQYNGLKAEAAKTSSRPTVMLDRIYGQAWNVPGGRSTMGTMIKDAGGINIFGANDKAGSLQLSPEKVLYEAKDADIWLIRFSYEPLTMNSLAEDKAMYTQFKAYKEGRVYGSDSSKSNIFEDQAFHPQWILEELIRIFHPELRPGITEHRYYELLK